MMLFKTVALPLLHGYADAQTSKLQTSPLSQVTHCTRSRRQVICQVTRKRSTGHGVDRSHNLIKPTIAFGSRIKAASGTQYENSKDGVMEEAETANLKEIDVFQHVHFGAGRLGMGLVVPAIYNSEVQSFAVVDVPKAGWEDLERAPKLYVDISVNEELVAHNVKMLNANQDTIRQIISKAKSFSCCLGPAMQDALLPLFSTLAEKPQREQPILYCCENDHVAVKRLKLELTNKVYVVDCMVDRVCMERTVDMVHDVDEDDSSEKGIDDLLPTNVGDVQSEENSDISTIDPTYLESVAQETYDDAYDNVAHIDGTVHVLTEPWRGSIVILDPTVDAANIPFSSDIASVPRTDTEAQYLSERKLKLVNGMHTVMAFTTLLDRWKNGLPIRASEEYKLLKYRSMPRARQRHIEAWRAVQIAALIEHFGIHDLMAWHDCTQEDVYELLLQYSDEVLLDRFGRVDDLVSRVLGGGVANRWVTRLNPTEQWLRKRVEGNLLDASEAMQSVTEFFLYSALRDRYATLEAAEAYSLSALSALTQDTRKLFSLEYDITHKGARGKYRPSNRSCTHLSLRDRSLLPPAAAPAPAADTLQQRYAEIAGKVHLQRAKYARWLARGKVDCAAMLDCARALGLSLDLATGHISYANGAEGNRAKYHGELCFDLIYVRHGKTYGNTEPRIFQGNVDEEINALNEVGLQQAEDAADRLEQMLGEVQPAMVVVSPLGRAKDTAEAYVSRHPHLRARTKAWWDTREMAFGDWDNMLVKDMGDDSKCHLFYLEQNAMVRSELPYVSPTGEELPSENFIQVLKRMSGVLDKMNSLMQQLQLSENASSSPPVVVMFGHSMAGAALQILTGNGKSPSGESYLGFDGPCIMPNATPTYLHRV